MRARQPFALRKENGDQWIKIEDTLKYTTTCEKKGNITVLKCRWRHKQKKAKTIEHTRFSYAPPTPLFASQCASKGALNYKRIRYSRIQAATGTWVSVRWVGAFRSGDTARPYSGPYCGREWFARKAKARRNTKTHSLCCYAYVYTRKLQKYLLLLKRIKSAY